MVAGFADSKPYGTICFNPMLRNLLTGLAELIEPNPSMILILDSRSIHGIDLRLRWTCIKCEGNSSCGERKFLGYSFRNRIFRRPVFDLLSQIGTSHLSNP